MSRPYDYALAEAVLVMNYNWDSYIHQGKEDCMICQDEMKNTHCLKTDCGCVYHSMCILKNTVDFKRTNCPNCMREYTHDPEGLC